MRRTGGWLRTTSVTHRLTGFAATASSCTCSLSVHGAALYTSQRGVHASPPANSRVARVSRQTPAETPRVDAAPPLLLDPPFSAVSGESAFLKAGPDAEARDAGRTLVYCCRRCRTPIFSSQDLVAGSRVGHHTSGWPTFTHTMSARPLQRRSVLQRSTVRADDNDDSDASLSSSMPSSSFSGSKPSREVRLRSALSSVASTTTSLTTRGLPVEADLHRTNGRGVQPMQTRTWREQSLRDVNHRADPALMEGCCPACGCAVCRVMTSRGGDVRYVSTASVLVATPSPSE